MLFNWQCTRGPSCVQTSVWQVLQALHHKVPVCSLFVVSLNFIYRQCFDKWMIQSNWSNYTCVRFDFHGDHHVPFLLPISIAHSKTTTPILSQVIYTEKKVEVSACVVSFHLNANMPTHMMCWTSVDCVCWFAWCAVQQLQQVGMIIAVVTIVFVIIIASWWWQLFKESKDCCFCWFNSHTSGVVCTLGDWLRSTEGTRLDNNVHTRLLPHLWAKFSSLPSARPSPSFIFSLIKFTVASKINSFVLSERQRDQCAGLGDDASLIPRRDGQWPAPDGSPSQGHHEGRQMGIRTRDDAVHVWRPRTAPHLSRMCFVAQ